MHTSALFSLAGKTALITGGSRGLGLYMARGLGEMGARVVIAARKADELEDARAGLAKDGIDCTTIVANLARFELIPRLVDQTLEAVGGIDVLINNAGTIWNQPAEDHSTEGWNKVLDLNINAMFQLTREVGKRVMIPQRGGKILNVSSLAGLGGFPPDWESTYLSYCTSKTAVIGLTRGLATEWGKYNININAICPGVFPTAMANDLDREASRVGMAATPLARFGGEDDLKGLAVFLTTEASRHITGQAIIVDGGMTAAF
jgi:NAD(P)-dependent dehydrogenase (short-subunit alcohol dehydrogenase family)